MTTVAVLALCQVIADAVFATKLMHGEVGCFRSKLLHFFLYNKPLLCTLQIDGLHTLLVLFFCYLFIEDAKLFLVQANASETIATPEAIFAKLAFTAVGTVLSVINHVAVRAVRTLGAPLTAQAERETTTADAFPRVASVVHILRVKNPEAVIAVFTTDCFCKFAIFRTILDEVIPRFTQKKILKFTDKIHKIWGTKGNLMLTTV
jgi:hypothetical protein